MKGLIIYIRREKLEAVQKVLHQRNVAGFSVENVEGCGCQKSQIDLNSVYTSLSQNGRPNSNATNLHCGQK